MKPRGFSIFDVIVIVAILALLLTITIAARHKLGQADAISGCQANLKQLYEALVKYGQDHGGAFPRTRADSSSPLTAYTAPDAADPFAPTGPAINDVSAAAFLLARGYGVPAMSFVCPGALRNGLGQKDPYAADTVGMRSNFRARISFNYSLANMYPSAEAIAAGYTLDQFAKLGPSFVIAADMNSGDEVENPVTNRTNIQSRLSNSPNHQRDGQNTLHADGSIQFVPTPYSKSGDVSFYASARSFPQPASATDSVLVPVWKVGDQSAPFAVKLRRWVFIGALVFSTVLIAGAIVQSIRRNGMKAL